jgi:hypothetical protein
MFRRGVLVPLRALEALFFLTGAHQINHGEWPLEWNGSTLEHSWGMLDLTAGVLEFVQDLAHLPQFQRRPSAAFCHCLNLR